MVLRHGAGVRGGQRPVSGQWVTGVALRTHVKAGRHAEAGQPSRAA